MDFIDHSVRPQDDFFRHVNGKWLDSTEIPADRGRWGSFDELRKKSSENVLEVLEEAIGSNKYEKSSDQHKAAAFYKSGMDTTSINNIGINPLIPYFDRINSIETLQDVVNYNQETIWIGNRGFFGFAIFPDLKNSAWNKEYLTSGSIGLPERDYYLKQDDESKEIREKYISHIIRMFGFLGIDKMVAAVKAANIIEIESKIAGNMLSKEERRNPINIYNLTAIHDLKEIVPSIDWTTYFISIGAGEMDTVIITDANYFKNLEEILSYSSIGGIKDYLLWNELNGLAAYLSSDIEKANFEFYSRELSGVKEMRPRHEKMIGLLGSTIGEAIGKLYVDKYFPLEAKQKASEMVSNILYAYKGRIQNLEWMTEETKEKALEKLNNFSVKIGYPEKWEDYSSLEINSVENGGSFIENLFAVSKWKYNDMISKKGKKVDKSKWGMPPQTVNAYYSPLNNEIVFPAAILQPPFYDYKADVSVNYGGIGAVIGHEISHGFDDQGSRFDSNGNMANWWTDTDRVQFEERNKKLIEQFDAYEALPGVFVNGKFTLGENLGDLGGIHSAYDGLMLHLKENGRPADLNGMTSEQRFFFSWATIWRTKMRDEEMANRIKTDPHAPGIFRATGPLTNMDAFYDAFKVKEGDKMYKSPEERVKIW